MNTCLMPTLSSFIIKNETLLHLVKLIFGSPISFVLTHIRLTWFNTNYFTCPGVTLWAVPCQRGKSEAWLSLLHCSRAPEKVLVRHKVELYSTGYGNIWDNPKSVCPSEFCKIFKQRLLDIYTQKWRAELDANHVLDVYKHYKVNFQYENYLNVSLHRKYRSAITKLRLASHPLRIETGRHGQNRVDRQERICPICDNGDIEDEFHFVLVCTAYNHLRLRYINRHYRRNPSVYKFIQLMGSNDTMTINNLSYYIFNAFEVRTSRLQNT